MGEKQRGRRQERVKGAREEDESFFTQAEHGDKRNKGKKKQQPFHLSNYIYLSLAKTKQKKQMKPKGNGDHTHTHTHMFSKGMQKQQNKSDRGRM